MRSWVVGVALVATGCGGSPPARETSPSAAAGAESVEEDDGVTGSGTREDPVQLCHMDGAPERTDYAHVASYRCPDGSTPLGGDPQRAQDARAGNVGPGPDGHVVDHYEIPCPSGAIGIYVDAYHCPEGTTDEIDPANLTAEQLQRFAVMIRALHDDPSSQRAFALRRELMTWLLQTRQIEVVMCDFSAIVPAGGGRPWLAELTLSLAAGVIEDGQPHASPTRVIHAALEGLLGYYRAVIAQEGESAREPSLEALAEAERDGKLEERAAEIAAACPEAASMGIRFVR